MNSARILCKLESGMLPMAKLRLLVVGLLAIACLISAAGSTRDEPVGAAKTSSDNPEGNALLRQVRALIDIRAEGSPPFRMRARCQITGAKNKVTTGTYGLEWAAPTRWREEISLPGFRQVRIGDGEKVWEDRNVPYLTADAWEIVKLGDYLFRLRVYGWDSAGKVREKTKDGVRVRCVAIQTTGSGHREICTEPNSAVPVPVDYGGHFGFRYADFVPFGPHQFPHVMTRFKGKQILEEFRVEELAEDTKPDPARFVPSQNARSRRWCPDFVPMEFLPGALPPFTAGPNFLDHHVAIYGVAGMDANWHDVTVVESGGKEAEAAYLGFMHRMRFRPARCGNVPIETEHVLTFGNPE
jgi:hypothetical protein